MAQITPQAAERYAAAVVRALAGDFPSLRDRSLGRIVPEEVARQAEAPMRSFQIIVDNPSLANWVLAPDPEDIRRVVLVCRRQSLTTADTAHEESTNATLRALPL